MSSGFSFGLPSSSSNTSGFSFGGTSGGGGGGGGSRAFKGSLPDMGGKWSGPSGCNGFLGY